MTLYALDIPDDETAVPEWLERHLVGVHLGELAAELKVLHAQPPAAAGDIQRLLGSQLQHVLQRGLSDISSETIGRMLKQPEYLLQLQELLFLEGGEHWRTRTLEDEEVRRHVAEGGRRLRAALDSDTEVPKSDVADTTSVTQTVSLKTSVAWYRRPANIGFAVAASLLLGFFLLRSGTPTGVWPDSVIQHDVAAAPYFERLASSAKSWFHERPGTSAEVRSRLAFLRQRCSALIEADHSSLAPADREWLVERCRAWASKFDDQLANLDRGADPLLVRGAVDEDVRRLIDALRQRAKSLESA